MSQEQINAATNQFSAALSSFTKSLQPVGQTLQKSFGQASQLAKEKLGSTQDVTELPLEYRQLEQKLDNIRLLHEMFLKVSKNYTLPNYDYQPDISDRASEMASFLQTNATSFFAGATSPSTQSIGC
jgi:Bin/amphiphysin/Rvs domain for vesicular trafficking